MIGASRVEGYPELIKEYDELRRRMKAWSVKTLDWKGLGGMAVQFGVCSFGSAKNPFWKSRKNQQERFHKKM